MLWFSLQILSAKRTIVRSQVLVRRFETKTEDPVHRFARAFDVVERLIPWAYAVDLIDRRPSEIILTDNI